MFKVMPVHFLKHPSAVVFARGNEPTKKSLSFDEKAMAEARAEAFQQGYDEAAALVRQEFEEERAAFQQLRNQTFQAIQQQHETLIEQMGQAVPGLVMEAIRRIVGSIDFNADVISSIIKDLLKEVNPGAGALEVKLCERDLQVIKGHEREFTHLYPGIRFSVDSHLKSGDCLIQSRYGTIDGRISAKLENVEALLQ